MRIRWLLVLGPCLLVGAGCAPTPYERPAEVVAASARLPKAVDYNWDVRPILSNNCFNCHGNDPGKRKAGLRLDNATSAYAPVPADQAHRAIVPGDPGRSELFRRVISKDPEERMPPDTTHKVLNPYEVAVLEKWIKDGAVYKQHWAYTAPVVAKPMPTPWDEGAINTVDRYVRARLMPRGLKPSPEADRETLINRVTMDLTGLPPTLAEVDAFVADSRAEAYEKLVDRLLASPAYGERMAEDWMDVARYSETDGFLDDRHNRLFSPYRDWVIAAFNRNLPYNTFATWQLAGDLLPKPTREQVLATAFGRLGKRSTENGIIEEEYRVEYRNERSELVSKAFLGLTVQCAKCHDHKYDVISQKEYYSLAGFFNSIDERGYYADGASNRSVGPALDWPTPEQAKAHEAAQAAVPPLATAFDAAMNGARKRAVARVDALLGAGAGADAIVEQALAEATVAYYPLDEAHDGPIDVFKRKGPFSPAPQLPDGIAEKDVKLSASGASGVGEAGLERPLFVPGVKGQAFYVKDNRGFMAPKVGSWDRNQDFSIDLWIKLREGKPYEDATVVNQMDHLIQTADSGYNLALEKNHLRFDLNHASPWNKISVIAVDPVPAGKWTHVTVTYDGSSRAAGVKLYVDGRMAATEVRRDHLTRTILPTGRGGSFLGGDFYGFTWGKRFKAEEFTDGAIDELRLFGRALTSLEAAWLHEPTRGTQDRRTLREGVADLVALQEPGVREAKAALKAARDEENRIASAIRQVLVMGDTAKPRQAFLLARGQYDAPADPVEPGALNRVFSWRPDAYGRDRLGLAKWLFDKRNPLTARVYVNRLWAQHFGNGIVETIDDFGTQGSNPTNPELLDYLAVEFVRSGWDIKHLQKLLVMSATYRQSSQVSAEALREDPRNLYVSRGPRFRLSAEQIRDNALMVSGLMVHRLGGDSVYPHQPPGVWEDAGSSAAKYPAGVPEDDVHRRSLYTFVKRAAPPPNMQVFDFADRQVSTVQRRISNTPLQALVLLNDPQFVEAYRALAVRVLQQASDPTQQLDLLFRLATRRHPNAEEQAVLQAYRGKALATMERDVGAAEKLLSVSSNEPAKPVDASLKVPEVAATLLVAAAVMNSPAAYTLR